MFSEYKRVDAEIVSKSVVVEVTAIAELEVIRLCGRVLVSEKTLVPKLEADCDAAAVPLKCDAAEDVLEAAVECESVAVEPRIVKVISLSF